MIKTSDAKKSSARHLEKLDKQYLWHPFTQMQDWAKSPQIIVQSGKGPILTDIRGKKYLDGVSSLWVTVHGHRKREIDAAVVRQLKKIAHSTLLGLSNVPAVLLGEKLVSIAPRGLSKVFYSDSGSTSVEIALKIAFQYWQQQKPVYRQKTGFISLAESYHGDTIGSVSVGGIDLFHEIYRPLLFKTRKIPTPHCYRCTFGRTYPDCKLFCAEQAGRVIKRYCHETAALIIEPLVQGAAGMLMQPPGYLKKIRHLCTQHNILMIADEVATGFGRTGKMFSCEHEYVSPDILCVAKGITGGYLPLAATLTTNKIYQGFLGEHRDLRTFFHGHTYTGNPLACAAAIANIDLFRTEGTLARLQPKIAFLAKQLQVFGEHPHVGEVRQKGFMVGIELVKDRKTKQPYPLEDKAGIRVVLECRKKGLIIRPLGNVIVLMPPLTMSTKDLKRMVEIVYAAIERTTAG
ncbi:MAG: adenosylmethionine--8-amino-7-oxononanoate transaminase [Nitrospirae bacterium GWC2_56_14]|nr:MAG: adenosylmethionine--8-amino-7-oxononanoate transaminase [Nitrospirae bacterium GWC2_56_14]